MPYSKETSVISEGRKTLEVKTIYTFSETHENSSRQRGGKRCDTSMKDMTTV